MKTLADLRRAMTPGRKLALVYRHKKLDKPIGKEVVKTQSNGAWLTKEGAAKDAYIKVDAGGRATNRSWFTYPKASLLEITDKGFRIYNKGKRPLTPEESEIRAGYEKTRDPEQEKRDLLGDGSGSYWAAVRYFKDRRAEYLQGNKTQRGMRYDYSSGQVWDDRVRGDLCLEYVFV